MTPNYPHLLFIITITLTLLYPANPLEAQEKSTDYTKPYQKKALDIYRKSISIRSAETHGMVPVLAEYLAEQFRAGGFPAEDVHVLPFTKPGGEKIAALVVRYRGNGSSGAKPILLTAHMDVVDAMPEDWERDPFTLVEEDGYFFGRGTLDDKFGTTMLTAAFLRLKAEKFIPERDLIIAFTGDEETGMITTKGLVNEYRSLTDTEYALNADAGGGVLNEHNQPVSYTVQAAEKTYVTFELTMRNPGGHSSMPRADNAIYELADVLNKIEAYRFPVRSNEITLKYFELSGKARSDELGEAMLRFSKNPGEENALLLQSYPGEWSKTRTTCVATMLRAGHAENALPQSATATVNCRIFPGTEIEEVKETLAKIVENQEVEIKILKDPKASPSSPLKREIMAALTTTVHTWYPDIPIIPEMSTGGTDGLHFRAAGIPTYGVMAAFIKDDDIYIHGLNERVPVKSFYAGLEFWPALLKELAGKKRQGDLYLPLPTK